MIPVIGGVTTEETVYLEDGTEDVGQIDIGTGEIVDVPHELTIAEDIEDVALVEY